MSREIVPVEAAEYAAIEDRFAELIGTSRDVLVLQGEAALPLEAAARAVARPGSRALNVVTSPYGASFGAWLRDGGTETEDLVVEFDRAVTVELVREALDRLGRVDVVSVVHAEAASGARNPLAEIATAAHDAGAVVVVDAVASIGADELLIDAWDLDLTVVSTQKSLAGPSGISAAVVSDRAWGWIDANPGAPRHSLLSLLDWRDGWLRGGRTALPVIPHHVELRLFGEAVAEVGSLDAVIERHRDAHEACRRGLDELGLAPWIVAGAETNVATTFRPPEGVSAEELLARLPAGTRLVGPAPAAPNRALRVQHTGVRATRADVDEALAALRLARSAA